jgi:hypothetical protein
VLFQVFTTAIVVVAVLGVVAPCSLVKIADVSKVLAVSIFRVTITARQLRRQLSPLNQFLVS